jgi:hypothetical protein
LKIPLKIPPLSGRLPGGSGGGTPDEFAANAHWGYAPYGLEHYSRNGLHLETGLSL